MLPFTVCSMGPAVIATAAANVPHIRRGCSPLGPWDPRCSEKSAPHHAMPSRYAMP